MQILSPSLSSMLPWVDRRTWIRLCDFFYGLSGYESLGWRCWCDGKTWCYHFDSFDVKLYFIESSLSPTRQNYTLTSFLQTVLIQFWGHGKSLRLSTWRQFFLNFASLRLSGSISCGYIDPNKTRSISSIFYQIGFYFPSLLCQSLHYLGTGTSP